MTVEKATIEDKIHGVPLTDACTSNNGHWHCISCNQTLPNQLMKDIHIDQRGTHKMAWLCHEHGPEVP